MWFDPRSTSAQCQDQGYVVGGSGSRECDVSLTEAAKVHSIDYCMVLGKHCRDSTMAAMPVGVLSSASRSSS